MRTESWTDRRISMYTYEERMRAIQTYMDSGFRLTRTISQLGYPTHQALRNWYKEYKENGGLHQKFKRDPIHTEQQKQAAIEHYYANGRNLKQTSIALGYVTRDRLRKWVTENMTPEEADCITGRSVVKCTEEQKRQAEVEFCARGGSSEKIGNKFGVTPTTLYSWKKKLFDEGCVDSVFEKPIQTKTLEELQCENKALRQAITELEQKRSALEKDVHRLQLEHDVLKVAGEILKKEEGVNLNNLSNQEKAQVIGALRKNYSLKELLVCLKIAKSSYFYQVAAQNKPDKYEKLRKEIKNSFCESNGIYGYRRIYIMLKRNGITVSEKVIRRIMHEEDLHVIAVKRKKYNSYMGEISPAVENLIQRDFHADRPNEKWLTDITEFHIPAGKVYLSPILDCFDGLAVSWSIGTSPNADLVNSMLDNAVSLLAENEHPIVHSDRGGHYRWPGWIQRMDDAHLTRSMSQKGCSPDNSACEGFFGRLKNEMFYGRSWDNVSIKQFIKLLDNYIHWHNQKRIKISLNGMSPLEYRQSLGF